MDKAQSARQQNEIQEKVSRLILDIRLRQAVVAAHVNVVEGLVAVQSASPFGAALPSLPTHDTVRVLFD